MTRNTGMHRVLVVGAGSIGERHIRCFQSTGRAEVAFVEPLEQLRRRIADQYKVPAYADLAGALPGPWTSAVICTPAPLHTPMALQLADRGVHLLIEKPLSTTSDGLDELAAAVASQRLVAAVAYVHRANPLLRQMRDELRSGRFGQPVQLVMTTGQHFPTYRPAYRDTYYRSRATGGGAIQDALTHMLNAGEWLVGPIGRVVVDAERKVLDGVEVEDTVNLLARHDGVMASYSLNQHQPANELLLTVICTGGMVRYDPMNSRWRWMLSGSDRWNDEPHRPLERDELFELQARAFLDAVEGLADPLCTLQEGWQTLNVNLAALASADGGGWRDVEKGSGR